MFPLCGFSDNIVPVDIEKVDLQLTEEECAIIFLDLSNGEATLIQNGNGESILINTGGPGTEKELKQLLNMYNVSALNALIITKEDADYTSNIKWIIDTLKVDTIITGSHSSTQFTLSDRNVMKWKAESEYPVLPGIKAKVLNEAENYTGLIGMDLLVDFGENKILYMASADKEIEKTLINQEVLKDVDVLKVADFAREEGTSQAFIENIDPKVAVIFRKNNTNPSQDVIERLYETWIDIYQTEQIGNVIVKCTSENFEVITIAREGFERIN